MSGEESITVAALLEGQHQQNSTASILFTHVAG
jgi:hypothetical protein